MFPLLPILFAGGLLLAWSRAKGNTTPVLSTEQKLVYENAMTSETDPGKLADLAAAFTKEGFATEGKLLQTRSDWYAADKVTKDARRDAFRIGMASQDPAAVENLADAFQEQTATGSADALRNYAAGLRQGQMVETAVTPQGTADPASPINRLRVEPVPLTVNPALKISLNKAVLKSAINAGVAPAPASTAGNVSLAAPLPSPEAIAQMKAEQAKKNAAAAAAKGEATTPIFRAEPPKS